VLKYFSGEMFSSLRVVAGDNAGSFVLLGSYGVKNAILS